MRNARPLASHRLVATPDAARTRWLCVPQFRIEDAGAFVSAWLGTAHGVPPLIIAGIMTTALGGIPAARLKGRPPIAF